MGGFSLPEPAQPQSRPSRHSLNAVPEDAKPAVTVQADNVNEVQESSVAAENLKQQSTKSHIGLLSNILSSGANTVAKRLGSAFSPNDGGGVSDRSQISLTQDGPQSLTNTLPTLRAAKSRSKDSHLIQSQLPDAVVTVARSQLPESSLPLRTAKSRSKESQGSPRNFVFWEGFLQHSSARWTESLSLTDSGGVKKSNINKNPSTATITMSDSCSKASLASLNSVCRSSNFTCGSTIKMTPNDGELGLLVNDISESPLDKIHTAIKKEKQRQILEKCMSFNPLAGMRDPSELKSFSPVRGGGKSLLKSKKSSKTDMGKVHKGTRSQTLPKAAAPSKTSPKERSKKPPKPEVSTSKTSNSKGLEAAALQESEESLELRSRHQALEKKLEAISSKLDSVIRSRRKERDDMSELHNRVSSQPPNRGGSAPPSRGGSAENSVNEVDCLGPEEEGFSVGEAQAPVEEPSVPNMPVPTPRKPQEFSTVFAAEGVKVVPAKEKIVQSSKSKSKDTEPIKLITNSDSIQNLIQNPDLEDHSNSWAEALSMSHSSKFDSCSQEAN